MGYPIETAPDVAFQNPLRRSTGQYREALLNGIGARPLRTKTIRVIVSFGLQDRIKSKQVQRLLSSIPHGWDSQRKLHMNAVSLWVGPKSSILSIPSAAKVSRF